MVPMQVCALEQDVGDDAENGQRDTLLNHLQLNEVEGTAVIYKSQTVGRHLTAILICPCEYFFVYLQRNSLLIIKYVRV